MSDISDQVADVLTQHPFRAGEGFYAGLVVCDGCHQALGDPGGHILKFLTEVLDPHQTPEPTVEQQREDPRESRIVWKAS